MMPVGKGSQSVKGALFKVIQWQTSVTGGWNISMGCVWVWANVFACVLVDMTLAKQHCIKITIMFTIYIKKEQYELPLLQKSFKIFNSPYKNYLRAPLSVFVILTWQQEPHHQFQLFCNCFKLMNTRSLIYQLFGNCISLTMISLQG